MRPEMEKSVIRLAETGDIPAVKKLLEEHHAKNLTVEQRVNGFVTTDMTEQQLCQLCTEENGVIIATDVTSKKVVGLLLGASWPFLKPWPMFDYMAGILNNYTFQGVKLDAETSYQYGPVCIAQAYRGRGIGESLLDFQRQIFSPHYRVIVTFVNVLNPRSYAFHTRNQFADVGTFEFNGNQYHMLALSTQ